MREELPDSGWSFVATRDEAAALLATLVELDPEETYTKTELSEAAGVPRKTLYLANTIEDFVRVGLLRRIEGEHDEEPTFAVEPDSEILGAARAFDDALATAALEISGD